MSRLLCDPVRAMAARARGRRGALRQRRRRREARLELNLAVAYCLRELLKHIRGDVEAGEADIPDAWNKNSDAPLERGVMKLDVQSLPLPGLKLIRSGS